MGLLATFWQLLQREYAELFQRQWDFSLLTWIPLSIILIFPVIYHDSVPLAIPIIVVDKDHSSLSRSLTRFIKASSRLVLLSPGDSLDLGYLSDSADSLSKAQAAIRTGKASAILYIPTGSARQATREGSASLFLFYNNSYYTEGNFIAKEVSAIVAGFNKRKNAQRNTQGSAGTFVINKTIPKSIAPIKVQLTSLFNSSNSYQWALVSIIYPALLHLIMAAIFTVSFFRDYATPKRLAWLQAASNNFPLAFASKIIFYSAWFTALSLLSTLYMAYLGWPVNGSLVAMLVGVFLMYCTYLFGASIITVLLKDKLNTALSVISVFTSPALAYGNILFPVSTSSPFVRGFSGLLPFTHYIDIQAHTWLGGASFADSSHSLLVLLGVWVFTGVCAYSLVLRSIVRPLFLATEAEW